MCLLFTLVITFKSKCRSLNTQNIYLFREKLHKCWAARLVRFSRHSYSHVCGIREAIIPLSIFPLIFSVFVRLPSCYSSRKKQHKLKCQTNIERSAQEFIFGPLDWYVMRSLVLLNIFLFGVFDDDYN